MINQRVPSLPKHNPQLVTALSQELAFLFFVILFENKRTEKYKIVFLLQTVSDGFFSRSLSCLKLLKTLTSKQIQKLISEFRTPTD